MCGIVGMAGSRGVRNADLLRRMCDTLSHRGPDDSGDWWSEDGTVGLAMRRLAIIDLSPSGHQPMFDHGNDYAIVFNGEIYNYKELRAELRARGHIIKTASDTEVILEAYREWNTACVEYLTGMFALAIYDTKKKLLFIARDRAGEKPLFYLHDSGQLRFGSELKAILADAGAKRSIDTRAMQYYLSFGYVPGEMCILRGFAKLPPASAMTYDIQKDDLRIWRYWNLPQQSPHEKAGDEELLSELETLLESSVKHQLVADVPVGIMLSGGIDSSLVTAMAVRGAGERVKTYTVTFPGFGKYNEAPYAKIVAEHFGTDHTELEAGTVAPDILVPLARQYDEPIADSSMIPTFMLSQLIRRHATVALGGDGGDELFGGYKHYSLILKSAAGMKRKSGTINSLFGTALRKLLPPGFPHRDSALVRLSMTPHLLIRTNSYFDETGIRRILADRTIQLVNDSEKISYNTRSKTGEYRTLLQSSMSEDFLNYLPDDVLVKVDRASMLTSLEVRAPFLDHHVIEFAYRVVPDEMKATALDRKILLKRLAKRVLPASLDLDRKQGFSVPLGKWFSNGWGDYMIDVLTDQSQTVFDKKEILRLASLQRHGIFSYQRIFALTIFALWMKEYGIKV